MPETGAIFVVPGTLFPHTLIDQIMPMLSGTQWQLLCVIVRQTQGWFDPQTGGRKASDWLSHSQLRRRTGRSSEAISRAIDALVQKALIEVRDEAGNLLATAGSRQCSYSRLFYSLAPPLLSQFQPDITTPPTSKPKPPVTSNVQDNPRNSTRTSPDSQKAPFKTPTATTSISVLPCGQTATTKETATKQRPKKPYRKTASNQLHAATRIMTKCWPVAPERATPPPKKDGCGCFEPSAIAAPTAAASPTSAPTSVPTTDLDLLAFMEAYRTAYQKHRSEQCPSLHSALNSQEQFQLQTALKRYGLQRLVELLERFFESDLSYIRTHSPALPVFLAVIHILNAVRTRPPRNPTT